jgi:hypothetical protein
MQQPPQAPQQPQPYPYPPQPYPYPPQYPPQGQGYPTQNPAYGAPGYQGGAYPQPAPQVVVVVHQGGGGVAWHSSECDLCAAPGGPLLCLYVTLLQ